MSLQTLPDTLVPRPLSVQNAYRQLHQIYQTTYSYVNSESLEAHHLQQYGNTIISDAYDILLLMEGSTRGDMQLQEWVEATAGQFTELLTLVNELWEAAQDQYVES